MTLKITLLRHGVFSLLNNSNLHKFALLYFIHFITNSCNNSTPNFQKKNLDKSNIKILYKDSANQTKQYDSVYNYIEEIFKSKSIKKKKDLKCYIWSENDSKNIHLKFGYDLGYRLETIYNFYVDMETKEIKFMTDNGNLVLYDEKLDLDMIQNEKQILE
jgi:hypothetical protein